MQSIYVVLQYYSLFIHIKDRITIFVNAVLAMKNSTNIKHMELYKRIGLNIALQRKLHNMTQIQLAEAVNISRTHMSNIEAPNMITPMSLEVIFDIAEALNVSPDVLFKTD